MDNFIAPDIAFGALAVTAAVLYAAWNAFAAKNHRDAKLLAALGAGCAVGSAVMWL
jgi:hypothetical protein